MACTLSAEQIKSVKPQGFLHNKGTDCFNGRVITINGKITAAQTKVIAEAAEKFGNIELKNIKGNIEFKNVLFKYKNDEEYTLKGLNLRLETNKKLSL